MDAHALFRDGSPYLVSGLLMLSGMLFAFFRKLPRDIAAAFGRRFLASVTISNGDAMYGWARVWLDRHPYSRRAKNFTAKSSSSGLDDDSLRFLLTPAFGEHLLRHRGRLIWLERTREEQNDPDRGRRLENMTFRMLGGSRVEIERLLNDIAEAALELERSKTQIFVNDETMWNLVAARDPRPLDSIILQDGILERVLADLHAFRTSREWYRDMGIPHRRGVLLYGPPGTGKSSLAGALAGALKAPLYLLSLTHAKLDDSGLIELLHGVEAGAFLLLEDLDAAFEGRERNQSGGVTLSGLLNAIDGAAAKDGTILFVSTNHLDRLDPALTRPGRLDLHVGLGYADASQRRRVFQRFFPNSLSAEAFAEATSGSPVTTAELQEYLLTRRDCAERSLQDVRSWMRERTRSSDKKQEPLDSEAALPFLELLPSRTLGSLISACDPDPLVSVQVELL